MELSREQMALRTSGLANKNSFVRPRMEIVPLASCLAVVMPDLPTW
jgi:hypothetical protein